ERWRCAGGSAKDRVGVAEGRAKRARPSRGVAEPRVWRRALCRAWPGPRGKQGLPGSGWHGGILRRKREEGKGVVGLGGGTWGSCWSRPPRGPRTPQEAPATTPSLEHEWLRPLDSYPHETRKNQETV